MAHGVAGEGNGLWRGFRRNRVTARRSCPTYEVGTVAEIGLASGEKGRGLLPSQTQSNQSNPVKPVKPSQTSQTQSNQIKANQTKSNL